VHVPAAESERNKPNYVPPIWDPALAGFIPASYIFKKIIIIVSLPIAPAFFIGLIKEQLAPLRPYLKVAIALTTRKNSGFHTRIFIPLNST